MELFQKPTSPKTLRPHQKKAAQMIIDSMRRGNRRVVCQMPTGAGKTVTAAKMIIATLAKGNRVIFTAPAISLIDQTVAAFEEEGIRDIGVMQATHPRTNPNAAVQVASVQTLARREIPAAAIVIVDECHIRSEAIVKLMEDRPDIWFVGMSATPWAKGMGLLWSDLVIPTTISDLITQGFLSKFTALAPEDPDLSGVKVRAGEYVEGSLAEVMATPERIAATVQTWIEKGQERPTLAFGVNRAHAAMLQAEYRRRGVPVAYIDGDTPLWERESMAAAFKRGDLRVICSVRTMTTGVDLPVSCIVDAAPTKSEMLHVQKIGRGLRVNPGTEDCLILDHAGNSLRLGLVTDIHHDRLDTTPPDQKQPESRRTAPSICVDCGTVSSAPLCPTCGAKFAARPVEKVEAEELIELKPKPVTMAEKREWFAGLRWIAEDRDYKPGWAAQKYRSRFGVWPRFRKDDVEPERPSREIIAFVRAETEKWKAAQRGKR